MLSRALSPASATSSDVLIHNPLVELEGIGPSSLGLQPSAKTTSATVLGVC